MLARNLRAVLAAGTALSLAVAASPAAAQLVRSGDLVDAIDSSGNPGQLTIVDTTATRTDMTVLAPVVVSNWSRLNVPTGTTVNVANGTVNPTATLISRVIGADFSDISGTINAPDVNLWLINQNGILFGSGASVNSASFFASTLDVSDADLFDFYQGTNLAGNGSSTLRFSGPSSNTAAIAGGGATARFVTDGSLLFVGPQLNLDATFDAGTGTVAFLAASDVSVNFTPGSPLSYVINAGTTVADAMTIGGSVSGGSIDFQMITAAGVVNSLLRVDATLNATTALPTDTGIRLFANQAGSASVTVEIDGVASTTGHIDLRTDGSLTATSPIAGSGVFVRGDTGLRFDDVTATDGSVQFATSGSVLTGDVIATGGDIFFEASNNGSASFASLIATGGRVFVSGLIPGAISVRGAVKGALVNLVAVNNISAGDVTATSGVAALQALNGTILAEDISATGGDVVLFAPGAITTTTITAREAGGVGGRIDVDSTGGGNLSLGNVAADRLITLDTTGNITTGTINALGALNVGASLNPRDVTFNGSVSANELFARVSGLLTFGAVNQIKTITGLRAGGALLLENATDNLAIAGLVTAGTNDVTIRNSGDVTISGAGQVAGGIVAISADDQFINLRGSDAITASDRWVVYSAAPAGNTFGGLDSGNTAIWNGTIDTVAPESLSGNRYVFAFQPTLTVTSTDTSKVYGTDLTGALGSFFSVSGLQDGVAGAYLGDSVSGILTGAPSITSAGSVANADVAGGPYVMNVGQGSLVAANGYALAFDSNGRLTITPRDVTASVTVNNRTYDGTTAGTGTVTLDGVIAGDDVGTTGTTFTFDSRNAGTGRTVTIAGTSLTGADAGNYTLTVPATALADILARAITASVTVNNRTYDGTTAGTGTVTLDGVIAGDDVGTTGTTFTFDSRNAGTGRTVTIAGTSLTGADAGNYTLTVPATALADILARVILITADDQEKTQGTPDPSLTFVIGGDGLVEGDMLSGSLARDPGELIGDYRIGQGTLDGGSNYVIQFQDGTLTITAQSFREVPLKAQVLPGDIADAKAGSQLDIEVESLCADQEKADQEKADQEKEVCRISQY